MLFREPRGDQSGRRRPSLWAFKAALGGLACVLVLLSFPAVVAGFRLGPTTEIRDRLYARVPLSDAERAAFIAERAAMASWWPSPEVTDDLAMAYLAQAEAAGLDRPEGRRYLPDVLKWQMLSLARHPANSYGWARLAFARLQYNGPSALVADALEASVNTAPYEPRLMPARIAMLMATKPYASPALQARMPEQIALSWARQPHHLVRAAVDSGFEDVVADLVRGKPEEERKFDQFLGAVRAERAALSPKAK